LFVTTLPERTRPLAAASPVKQLNAKPAIAITAIGSFFLDICSNPSFTFPASGI
jgi:hypothetical protein